METDVGGQNDQKSRRSRFSKRLSLVSRVYGLAPQHIKPIRADPGAQSKRWACEESDWLALPQNVKARIMAGPARAGVACGGGCGARWRARAARAPVHMISRIVADKSLSVRVAVNSSCARGNARAKVSTCRPEYQFSLWLSSASHFNCPAP